MRAVAHVLALGIGGVLLSLSVAFAQTPSGEAAPAPVLGSAFDAGSVAEPALDAAPTAPPQTPSPVADAAPSPTSTPGSGPPATTPPEGGPAGRPERVVHDGFYLGLSTGFGDLAVWGNGPSGSASISGFATNVGIAVGGSPVTGLAVAGVIQGSIAVGDTFSGGTVVTATVGNMQSMPRQLTGNSRASSYLVGVLVDWFPVATGGWHVGAAIGAGGASVTDDAGDVMAGISVGGSVFGGHQWWLGKNWSFGITGFVTVTPNLTMTDSRGNDTGYSMLPLQVGVQFPLLYY